MNNEFSKPYWTEELVRDFTVWMGDDKPAAWSQYTIQERVTWFNEQKLKFLESRLPKPPELLLG